VGSPHEGDVAEQGRLHGVEVFLWHFDVIPLGVGQHRGVFAPEADGGPLFNSLFAFYLLALAYGCLLLSAVLGNWLWQRVLASKPMRFVGLISYSLYIWHWPLYQHVIAPIAGRFHGDALKMLAFVALIPLIVFPVGYLSYQFVERPFIRFRLAQH
jgi:peptidoglycan/LPS O-acetylase OafA/YrhL